jgi:site-specific recombinase XerD
MWQSAKASSLSDMSHSQRAAGILKQQKTDTRSQWVWTSCDGRRKLTRSWPAEQFRTIRDEFKLPWDCVLHSCRHTLCTRLGEQGLDAFSIRDLAGHSSIVISQRYVHPTPKRLEQGIGLLESYGASTKSSTETTGHNGSG